MNVIERRERERFTKAAHSFLGTPYHHEARLKGGGIDCATLLAEAAAEARIIPRIDLPHYPAQWMHHRHRERLVEIVSEWGTEVFRTPIVGDIVLWKFYNLFCHASIVTAWPNIIHSYVQAGKVVEEQVDHADWLRLVAERGPDQGKPRPMRVFSLWPRKWGAA